MKVRNARRVLYSEIILPTLRFQVWLHSFRLEELLWWEERGRACGAKINEKADEAITFSGTVYMRKEFLGQMHSCHLLIAVKCCIAPQLLNYNIAALERGATDEIIFPPRGSITFVKNCPRFF